ncbi:MAG: phage minor capsid protein [Oscillospiraceae bacterium]|nr:phage minor capsid protein [Oscillospiraceae bacterium]
MLTPKQLQNLPKELTDLYSELSDFILRDIARRIAKGAEITDTAEYQLYRARSLGLSEKEIAAKIAEINGTSTDVIDKLIRDAAVQSDEFDRRMLGADDGSAVPLKDNEQLQKLMAAQITETAGACENLTGTLGFADHDFLGRVYYLSMTDMYRRELDAAHMKVVTGATDYMTAIRQACNKLAASGVRTIDYESGRSDRVEVAVRRALMTSVSHITQRISEQNAEEFGADGWEISAHSGARPSHAIYQGRQFPNSKYDSIVKPLIEDYNCRHSAFPIIIGISEPVYTEEELRNIDPPPFTYEGRKYTAYEAQQQMRKMERAMRKQKDRCIVADAAGDKEGFTTASLRLNRQKYIYEDFAKAADCYTEYERTFTPGFSRSLAVKSGINAVKKEYNIIAKTLDKSDVPSLDEFKKMLYNNGDEYKQLRHQFNEKVINSDYEDIKHLNGCLSDKVTRQWYVLHDKKIPNLIDKTKPLEDQARQAHSLRNQFRTNARDLMLNQDERKWLDISHPNLTFEEQIGKKMSDKGMTRDEAVLDILATASKSNNKVNEKFKL